MSNEAPLQSRQLHERTPAFLAAMEANIAEEVTGFGRNLPHGEMHENEELSWFFTGRPYLNGVTRTHLLHDDEAYVHQKIMEIISYYKQHNRDFSWAINSQTYPSMLGKQLVMHGFTPVVYQSWMALDIDTMQETSSPLSELVIEEIQNAEMLRVYCSVARRGFEMLPSQEQTYYQNYLANGFGPDTPWHHYTARLDGQAVAGTSLLLYAGIAGIYGVTTLENARRQGIGTAMTLHALRHAQQLGYHIAVLVPSHMGEHLYRRIGFEKFNDATIYILSYETMDTRYA